MRELAELTRTAGGEVIASEVQRRDEIDPALFAGRGKVAEIRERRGELDYDIVICNEDLSPRQQRNLERELGVRVVDRTELILDIFAQHARTREGRLQVEVASLHHWLPRLIGAYTYNRQVGGIGARGGPGSSRSRSSAGASGAGSATWSGSSSRSDRSASSCGRRGVARSG
jgi:GTP-binding protein HflX